MHVNFLPRCSGAVDRRNNANVGSFVSGQALTALSRVGASCADRKVMIRVDGGGGRREAQVIDTSAGYQRGIGVKAKNYPRDAPAPRG